MNDITPRNIKTGSDPRRLSSYAALRDELSKLTHPARPDVNWQRVENLGLSLFEQNGVDLQTAAWFTLARTHLAGLPGLNEGLAVLEMLISHRWQTLWPQSAHVRMEILSSLSHRLLQRMRSLPLNFDDLNQLYRAEQLLIGMGEALHRLEIEHFSQLDTLLSLIQNTVVRLENSDGQPCARPHIPPMPDIVVPAAVINDAAVAWSSAGTPPEDTSGYEVKWGEVTHSGHQVDTNVPTAMPASVKRWKSFLAGMFSMLVISAVAVWCGQSLYQPHPLQTQLSASLAPLPAILTPAQLELLRQQAPIPQDLIIQTQQQLARLDKLPPDWTITQSQKLAQQAQILRPEQAKKLLKQWEQQRKAATLPAQRLYSWHQGMMALQTLSEQLNGLDEQKGKFMTVSELKSAIFSAIQLFNQSIPAEEQLRVLSENPAGEPLPAAARAELEMHLKQLVIRYADIKQQASE